MEKKNDDNNEKTKQGHQSFSGRCLSRIKGNGRGIGVGRGGCYFTPLEWPVVV